MSRIAKTFAAARARKRPAFVAPVKLFDQDSASNLATLRPPT